MRSAARSSPTRSAPTPVAWPFPACLAAEVQRNGQEPARWRQHDVRRPKPPAVEPGEGSIAARPPKDAVVLFDGSSLDAWKSPQGGPARWKVADGYMETAPGAGPI